MERMTDFDAGKLAIKTICDASNGGRSSEIVKGMIEALRYEHRTLQADFWRTVQLASIGYSEFDHDLRNKSAVELCQVIKKDGKGIPRI